MRRRAAPHPSVARRTGDSKKCRFSSNVRCLRAVFRNPGSTDDAWEVGLIRVALAGLLAGCGTTPALELAIDSAPEIDSAEIRGALDDGTVLPTRSTGLPPSGGNVLLLLPDRFTGRTVALEVLGRSGDRAVARWRGSVEVTSDLSRASVHLEPRCGDGLRSASERCDDGNTTSSDGCSARCSLEPGWACDGEPSACVAEAGPMCGDGVVTPPEICDDGATAGGDGCSETCTLEVGWTCSGAPSACRPVDGVCPNGVVEPPEDCDDGNASPQDGCYQCQEEPGWLCYGSPSRCIGSDVASLVDGDGPSCPFGAGSGTREDPFCSVEAALLNGPAGVLILAEGLLGQVVIDGDYDVRLVGDGSVVIASDHRPALKIKGGAHAVVENVTVSGMQGAGGGIKLETEGSSLELERVVVGPSDTIGIEVKAGALTISKSRITGNANGGAKLDGGGIHRLVNTVVAQNGTLDGDVGGVSFVGTSTASALINVTVADNSARPDRTGGVQCSGSVDIVNSIVWNNAGGDISGVDPTCSPRYSVLGADREGIGNVFADPRFLDEDYHVATSSDAPCIDAGDPEPAPPDDIDGDPRPLGATVDIGADEAG